MTVELNIFNTCNQLKDEEDMHDVDLIETLDSYDKKYHALILYLNLHRKWR